MPTPPSIQRVGIHAAHGWPATRVLARRALSVRPLADPCRPSDAELDRIDWAFDLLGSTRVLVLQTATPGVELVAAGRWTLARVREALAHFVDASTATELENLLSGPAIGEVVRVVGAVDGRTDRTTFRLASELATTPAQPHLAERLCTALCIPAESVRWLSSVHHNLTRHSARTSLIQLDVVDDGIRPWLTMRYPDCPPAAAQAVRSSLAAAGGPLPALPASAPLTLEVRVADQGAPRLGLETKTR